MLRLFIVLLFVPALFYAREWKEDAGPAPEKKLCLNMIVKNESKVIKRCLDSVKSIIDTWVIVDTGSTDGTQKIIKQHLKGIPGKLYERPWKNFGENRTEALQLAQGHAEYILFMDADDVLEFDGDFDKETLTLDLYNMWRGTPGFTYLKPQIVRADLPWKWLGVTHEYLDCPQLYTSETLEEVRYVSKDDGASSYDPKKFLKNVALLEEGLKKEPNNYRYMFYLAESYRDSGEKGKALEWYQKRIAAGGWDEEVFWSKLQAAHLMRALDLPVSAVIESYLDTYSFRPHRIEPLYYLAEIYNKEGKYEKAYALIKSGLAMPKPTKKDALFNVDWIEEYGLLFQLSISAHFVGKYQEALDACDQLLKIKNMPESWLEQTRRNREFPLEKLKD